MTDWNSGRGGGYMNYGCGSIGTGALQVFV